MIEDTTRRSFIFGITLTEVLVLFVFLLALLIGGNVETQQKESVLRGNLPESVVDLQDELVGIRARAYEEGNQLSMLRSEYSQLVDENASLRDMVYQEFSSSSNPDSKTLLSALAPLMENDESVEFLHDVADALSEGLAMETLKERNELLSELLDAEEADMQACMGLLTDTEADDSLMDIQECTGKLRYLEKTYAQGISDVPPPCWLSPSGKSQSLFRVQIDVEGFAVDKAWSESRDVDAAAVKGAVPMIGRRFDAPQFLAATEELFEQSLQLKCRHVVDVYDLIDSDKELYKSSMKTIETRFYKNLR